MSVKVGAGLSTGADPGLAALEAATAAEAGLQGESADLVVLFASGAHLTEPQATLAQIHNALQPGELIGCGAGGVLGAGRELEGGSSVAVWAASFSSGSRVTAFHAELERDEDDVQLTGLPPLAGARAAIVLPDPYTFPTDALLELLASTAPAVPVLGGLCSAASRESGSVLFIGDEVVSTGAVGVRLDGVEMLPCVSQGATPVGPELTITASEGNVIRELAGAPALGTLERVIEELPRAERALLSAGLMLGVVIDGGKPEYTQGDFLVRPLAGVDREHGWVAIGAVVREGQVVRLHARDAVSADRDLRQELALRSTALAGERPAGVLVFSCNGRGRGMFGTPDHDALAVQRQFGGAPSAGFFAAGEIGPVGGRNFLHGFTATIGVFPV